MRVNALRGAAALGLLASPAFAADVGNVEPLPTPDYTAAAPANNWTGFHLGALLGWSWGNADTDDPAAAEIGADGIDGGAYAGYDYQWGNFVLGAEGDFIVSGVDGSDAGVAIDQGLNGSLRARAGIALDRFLLYGTGGVALTELEASGGGVSDEETLWGWTAGAGAEAQVWNNVTARVEYRYTDYEDATFTLGGGPLESDYSTHSLRAGVGVKF